MRISDGSSDVCSSDLFSCQPLHRMPSKVVQMIWSMPVYPSPYEQLCSPAVRVRGADDSLPAGFQYLMNVPQKGRRIRCMLDHLVERDNIELLWSIAGRLEQARRNIESVPLRDA